MIRGGKQDVHSGKKTWWRNNHLQICELPSLDLITTAPDHGHISQEDIFELIKRKNLLTI